MYTPFLSGNAIDLRAILEEDLTERYRDWFNDEEVCAGNSHHRFPYYGESMREYYERVIRSSAHLVLAIVDKATGAHIGNVSLQDIDPINRSAEFAIVIGEKEHRGKGVGKEAMRLIVTHGFRELNLHRIRLGTYDNNASMRRVAEALGFIEEGRERSAIWKGGAWRDVILYGLLAEEWKN